MRFVVLSAGGNTESHRSIDRASARAKSECVRVCDLDLMVKVRSVRSRLLKIYQYGK